MISTTFIAMWFPSFSVCTLLPSARPPGSHRPCPYKTSLDGLPAVPVCTQTPGKWRSASNQLPDCEQHGETAPAPWDVLQVQ